MNGQPAENINDEDMIPPLIGPNGEVIAPARPANPAPVAQPPPVQPAPVQEQEQEEELAPTNVARPKKGAKLTVNKLIASIKNQEIDVVRTAINDPDNSEILAKNSLKPKGFDTLPEPKPVFKITPLIAAVSTNNEQLIELILNKMVELGLQHAISVKDSSNNTAADYASKLGSAKIAGMIVAASTSGTSTEPLKISANTECETPLECALKAPNDIDEINKIVDNEKYMKTLTPKQMLRSIITAIQTYPSSNKTTYGQAIGKLLDKIIEGKTGLKSIGDVWKANTGVFKGSSYPDANKEYTLFMYIAMTPGADTQLMDIFLKRIPFAYIVAKDADGNTMLHHLAQTAGPEKVELLKYLKTKSKYAPSLTNNKNETVLFSAVRNSYAPMALELFKDKSLFNPTAVNFQNADGNTLLIEATKTRNIKVLEELNANEADVDVKNKEGKVAADYVVEMGKVYTEPTARRAAKIVSNTAELDLTRFADPDYFIKYAFWNSRNVNFCPVCLMSNNSDKGCIFQLHNCKETAGNIVHEELYNALNENGKIGWCKNCCDYAMTHGHNHYSEIGQPKGAKRPNASQGVTFFQKNRDLTDHACRSTGGLGYIQKYNKLYTYYNELCKMKQELAQGKKISKVDGKRRLVEAIWNASKPVMIENKLAPNPEILPRAREIMAVLHADFNELFSDNIHENAAGDESTTVDAAADPNHVVRLVTNTFKQFNHPFICDVKSKEAPPAPADNTQAASNIGSTVASNTEVPPPAPNTADVELERARGARNDELLENHKFLVEKLEERLQQGGGFPPFERDPDEVDNPGPNGEKDEATPVVEGSARPDGGTYKCAAGAHNDGRNLYRFSHFQKGSANEHFLHDDEQAIFCAADLREFQLEGTSMTAPPADLFIDKAFGMTIAGVGCVFNPTCKGDIYPEQLNAIPSEEFYLPTQFDDTVYTPEERKQKGDAFKKNYNDIFVRNRVIYDFDMWAQEDVMKGGAEESGDFLSEDTLFTDLVQTGEVETLCPLPPKQQKAGFRFKTYRQKGGVFPPKRGGFTFRKKGGRLDFTLRV